MTHLIFSKLKNVKIKIKGERKSGKSNAKRNGTEK
jgi:hypothetical protein